MFLIFSVRQYLLRLLMSGILIKSSKWFQIKIREIVQLYIEFEYFDCQLFLSFKKFNIGKIIRVKL